MKCKLKNRHEIPVKNEEKIWQQFVKDKQAEYLRQIRMNSIAYKL